MNKAGFTLVELLAAMVILGILMGVAIPNIVGTIARQRNNVYVEDAKRLVVRARTTFASDTSINKVDGVCFTLEYLDNGDFDEPPNGGVYLKSLSYVKYDENGHYIVTLIECVNCKEKTTEQIYATNMNNKDIRIVSNVDASGGVNYNDLINDDKPTRFVTADKSKYLTPTQAGCDASRFHDDENEEEG
jgi:prepilin-type N-terminal cleavage/methylation domain-containing protein